MRQGWLASNTNCFVSVTECSRYCLQTFEKAITAYYVDSTDLADHMPARWRSQWSRLEEPKSVSRQTSRLVDSCASASQGA